MLFSAFSVPSVVLHLDILRDAKQGSVSHPDLGTHAPYSDPSILVVFSLPSVPSVVHAFNIGALVQALDIG